MPHALCGGGTAEQRPAAQVTALGGLEAVMANKKWTEVSQPFQFPPSFTSKSFTLRKMYSRLLHDYEQVYFHRNGGLPIPPPGEPGVLLLAWHCPSGQSRACMDCRLGLGFLHVICLLWGTLRLQGHAMLLFQDAEIVLVSLTASPPGPLGALLQ